MSKELEERQALHMIERSLGDHGWFGWEEVETLDNAINELEELRKRNEPMKVEQAQKQEELLELYKQLNKLYQELYTMELSQLVLNQNYYEIEIIKLKQQIKELENENI